jgi:hypothetical protein
MEPSAESVRADQKIGKNTAWSGVALFSALSDVGLKSSARGTPSGFVQIPVDGDRCVSQKQVEESLIPTWRSHQFGKDRPGQDQIASV